MQRSGGKSVASGSLYNRSVRQQGVTRASREGNTGHHRIHDVVCIYRGDLGLLGIFQCQVNRVLKFAGTVEIRGLGTFSICKSRRSRHRFSYGGTLKLSGIRCLCKVWIGKTN